MNNKNLNVVIVGGGLVGPVCALYMARRGYNVSLYEYRHDPRESGYLRGRSINLAVSNRARKALRELGLEEDVLQSAIPMKGRYLHELNGKNKAVLYDTRTSQCIYSVSRNYLNRKLLDAMDEYENLKLVFNHRLVDAKFETGSLTFLQSKTNTRVNVNADLVIGADGAYSTLRKCMLQKPLFDYTQNYANHGYIELNISPESGNGMVPNHLHIWPRGKFMMIALPNRDASWTVTLFMAFEEFEKLDKPNKVITFFSDVFPDIIPLIGEKQIVEDFLKNSPSALITVKCGKYHIDGKALLLGDAAHAMVPFYGQGMNAGFEDCVLFNSILDECMDDIPMALEMYTSKRKNDAHAICDLAFYNYVVMRDLVTKPSYHVRKYVDDILYKIFPNSWVPLYNSIAFTEMSYEKCLSHRRWQDKMLLGIIVVMSIFIGVLWIKL